MQQKDHSLDFLRVLSMFLVIVIHVSNVYCRDYSNLSNISYFGAVIFNSLARISVPIFFMISGALLIGKEYDFKKYKERVFKFIRILVIWTLIYFIFDYFYFAPKDTEVISLLQSLFIPIKNHLWFMYAIIGLYIALPFVTNMLKNMSKHQENLFLGLWMGLCGGVYIFRLILSIFYHFPTNIIYDVPLVQGTYYLGYFIAGYILYKRKDNLKIKDWMLVAIFIASMLINIFGTYYASLATDMYNDRLLAYRSLLYIVPSIAIYLLVIRNYDNSKPSKLFSNIAPYSFGVYLIHIIFLFQLMRFTNLSDLISFVGIPLYSFIIFIVSLISVYLLKKIPLLGKNLM